MAIVTAAKCWQIPFKCLKLLHAVAIPQTERSKTCRDVNGAKKGQHKIFFSTFLQFVLRWLCQPICLMQNNRVV